MRLLIKNNLRYYEVYNEKEERLYDIKRRVISFGERYEIFDNIGSKIGFIEPDMGLTHRGFRIYHNDSCIEFVEKQFSFFNESYRFMKNNWSIASTNLFYTRYDIKNADNKVIIKIKVNPLKFKKYCEIEVFDEIDTYLCTAISMAILFISQGKCDRN